MTTAEFIEQLRAADPGGFLPGADDSGWPYVLVTID